MLAGGVKDDRDGWFVFPTIVGCVSDEMEIAHQEVFGPVLSVLSLEDDADFLERANDSDFGLAADLWSRDVSRVRRMADGRWPIRWNSLGELLGRN
jgi:aldehyde dehydrogenase (NAD+)